MNAATSLSSAFMRRLARTPLRRRAVLLPSRQLSSTAPVFKQRALPKPLDPYSSSALAALLARLSLPSTPALQQTLMACLTHPSFSAAEAQDTEATTASAQENNELLASLGNSLLGLFASEEIAIRYPQLPSNALSAAVTSYVGPNALSSVARDLGLGVTNKQPEVHANAPAAMPIRWKRTIRSRFPSVNEGEEAEAEIVRRKDNFQEGLASVVRSFVGLVYQEQGMHAAREFVHAHFMSRHVDLSSLFSFRKPKYVLSNVVSKHLADAGVPLSPESSRIESRVLASSGVATQAPLFNIGLFLSNGLKLAEGHGSTLLMAEHRAAHNALLSLFLVQETSKRTLPTAVHTERPAAAAPAPEEKSFVPNTAAAGRESLLGLGPAMRQAL